MSILEEIKNKEEAIRKVTEELSIINYDLFHLKSDLSRYSEIINKIITDCAAEKEEDRLYFFNKDYVTKLSDYDFTLDGRVKDLEQSYTLKLYEKAKLESELESDKLKYLIYPHTYVDHCGTKITAVLCKELDSELSGFAELGVRKDGDVKGYYIKFSEIDLPSVSIIVLFNSYLIRHEDRTLSTLPEAEFNNKYTLIE